jgi:hypothetical protein
MSAEESDTFSSRQKGKQERNIPATIFMCLDHPFLLGLSLLLANLFPLLVRRLLVLAVVAHRWPLSTCSFRVSILPPPTTAVLPSVRLAPTTALAWSFSIRHPQSLFSFLPLLRSSASFRFACSRCSHQTLDVTLVACCSTSRFTTSGDPLQNIITRLMASSWRGNFYGRCPCGSSGQPLAT